MIPSKRTDSSDFIFYNNFNNNYYNGESYKKENNFSLPSKRITKKINSNSYSNIHTSNNSPNNFFFKNNDIFKINNNNLDNFQIIKKHRKISDFLEDYETNDLLKLISISERSNSKSNIDDNINNKNKNNNIINDKNEKENKIGLYYTSEKNGNRNESKINILSMNYSNVNSYINKIKEKNLMKNYSELKSNLEKETNIYFEKQRNIYKNENKKNKKSSLNFKNIDFILNKQKYTYNNENNDKSGIIKKNEIKHSHNYYKQTKTLDNFYIYNKNNKSKRIFSPFEKIKEKKVNFIFPVNPFDSIN